MQKANVKAGDILLFHEDYLHTIQALPDILDHLLMKGIKFFPVGELISSR
jgi:peptidoglycan/xylan/chitin deacetylase (PgdA/CDA1 family)